MVPHPWWGGHPLVGVSSMQGSFLSMTHRTVPSIPCSLQLRGSIFSGIRQISLHVSSGHFICMQELSSLCGIDFGNKSKKVRKALSAFLPAERVHPFPAQWAQRQLLILIRQGEGDGERGKKWNQNISSAEKAFVAVGAVKGQFGGSECG